MSRRTVIVVGVAVLLGSVGGAPLGTWAGRQHGPRATAGGGAGGGRGRAVVDRGRLGGFAERIRREVDREPVAARVGRDGRLARHREPGAALDVPGAGVAPGGAAR